ncbi:MAG TPA: hypothetical protein ENG95_05940 [Nitrospirae bacterium]|nr:hypothetical protein [Nitrospirota bacterium]
MIEKPYYYDNRTHEFVKLEGAKIIKFDITGDYEFYVHKNINGQGWTLTDSRSGVAIEFSDKRADVILKSKTKIKKYGVKKFHDLSRSTLQRALNRPVKIALLEEFGKVTGLLPAGYRNPYLEQLTGPSFDPVQLDSILSKHNKYDHSKSCKDNLAAIYGKRAKEIAEALLKLDK